MSGGADRPELPFGAVVDPDSDVPLYRQVRAILEDGLSRGLYSRNRPLPSTRFLAENLGVSRNTIALACQELISVGLVESRPRSGLYPVVFDAPGKTSTEAVSNTTTGATTAGATTAGATTAGASTAGISTAKEPRRFTHDAYSGSRRNGKHSTSAAAEQVWARKLELHRDQTPHLPVTRAPSFPDWQDAPFPFISGQPDVRSFPVRSWQRALSTALDGPHLPFSIRDSGDRDDPLLVEAICNEILPARGVNATPDEVLVTAGAQQGLSLIADVLLRPGNRVLVENPGYVDAWHLSARTGAEVVPHEVDRAGLAVESAPDFDAVYLTPSHHHPTNVTLALPRRRMLLDRLAATDSFAIEDDYDSEFRFRGRPTPSLKSLDTDGRVLYLGSFSKFLAAGLRLGFVVGPADVIAALRAERHHRTKHLPGHLQRGLGLFIVNGDYHRTLRHHRQRLRRNWEEITQAAAEFLPGEGDPTTYPPGGVSLWYSAPAGVDCKAWAFRARSKGVILSDGSRYYYPGTWSNNHLRLGFSSIRTEAIRPGIAALASVIPR